MKYVTKYFQLFLISIVVYFLLMVTRGLTETNDSREFIEDTCQQYFNSLSNGLGLPNEEKFALKYMNKWIKWSATITHIERSNGGIKLILKCDSEIAGKKINVSFENSEIEQFSLGQKINFSGQINDFKEATGTSISNGEVIERKYNENSTKAMTPNEKVMQETTDFANMVSMTAMNMIEQRQGLPIEQQENTEQQESISKKTFRSSTLKQKPNASKNELTDNTAISRIISNYFEFMAQKRIDDVIDQYAPERRQNLKRKILESNAKDTEYYKIEAIKVGLDDMNKAKALVQLNYKKYKQPEEKWEIEITLVKINEEWKIWSTPGKKVN